MGTFVPYFSGTSIEPGPQDPAPPGRSAQKARTRAALVDAARRLLAEGTDISVESVAAAAGISRTTAYRYFPHRRDLVGAAHPQIDVISLLPDPAPTDVPERLAMVMRAFLVDVTVAWEPQLRAALRQSLAPGPGIGGAGSTGGGTLRQGRAIGWIQDALEPLQRTHPTVDVGRLAVAIRSAAGIESLVWLTDVAGLSREEAVEVMSGSAQALLSAALQRAVATARP